MGAASGKKKSDLVLRTSRGNGWTDGGTERGTPNTCRPVRSHKDSAQSKGKKFSLTLRWTAGHVGIPGNKEADELTKCKGL